MRLLSLRLLCACSLALGVFALLAGQSLSQVASAPTLDPATATIPQLQTALGTGQLTSRALVESAMARIDTYDRKGPRINAVAELNPEAGVLADALDAERQQGRLRGALHGIPILIKDNIDTGDQMHTTAGALVLKDMRAREDAFVVRRLRAAGALILGKANLTEFANFVALKMPNGYSSRGGQVANPYNLRFDPSGSSSGSAAAVAAGYVPIAVGSETSGSILSPSNDQSLVGIKPTLGLVSRTGIIPIAHSQDTAGPIARTVTDAAIALGAMTGVDPQDPATTASAGHARADYTPFLRADGLRGKRLGIPRRGYFDNRREAADYQVVERAIALLKAQGAILVDPADLPAAERLNQRNYFVLDYEFKSDLAAYFARGGEAAPVKSLAEVIAYNRAHRKQALRYGQDVLLGSEKIVHNARNAARYRRERALDLRLARTEGIDAVMQKYNLDALVFPMSNGADVGARAGYPTVIVPAGYRADGHPVGISFLGRAWSEPTLLAIAYAFEQASHARRAPVLAALGGRCRYGQQPSCR
jgi:amidase